MDTTTYVMEVEQQLSDETSYIRINHDPTSHISRIIRMVLEEAWTMGIISESLYKSLLNTTPRSPVFYILPKIHKNVFPPLGRLIISASNSILEPLAIYLDYFLQLFVQNTPSYIKDTRDFINKIEGLSLPEEATLITMDVTSLYTSIPQDGAHSVVEIALRSRLPPVPPSEFLLQLFDLVVEKNFFRFNDNVYYQIKGVAMGCATAPSVANLFMADFEEKFIYNPQVHDSVCKSM